MTRSLFISVLNEINMISVFLYIIFFNSVLLQRQQQIQAVVLQHSNKEKTFSSIVSINAFGDKHEAIDEKEILEETFKSAYNNLLHGRSSGSSLPSSCSLRSLYDVTLIDIDDNDENDVRSLRGTNSNIITLYFELKINCYDCLDTDNKSPIFLYDYKNDENEKENFYSTPYSLDIFGVNNNNENNNGMRRRERNLQNNQDNNCYWSNYDYESSTRASDLDFSMNNNNAPLQSYFVQEFNNILLHQGQDYRGEVFPSSIELRSVEHEETILVNISDEPIPCPCPKNSYCGYKNNLVKDFWEVTDGLYHNCTCKDGFSGEDGWRCEEIDECNNSDEWPCAPIEEGGFCVNAHPDNINMPKYKCGCRSGYIPNENFTIDENHGAMHCVKLYDENWCNKERIFPTIVLSLDVTGNPDAIIQERIKIQDSIKIAYERAFDGASCQKRFLDDVTFFKIKKDDGQYIDVLESTNRYLMEEDNKLYEDKDNSTLSSVVSSTILNSTDITTSRNLDVGFALNLNFNFSVWFTMLFRCFGCPKKTMLFDDASRRRRNLQGLLDENDDEAYCDCSQYDDDIEELSSGRSRNLQEEGISSSLLQPSSLLSSMKGKFIETFNEVIEEEELETLQGATSVEDKTDYTVYISNDDDGDDSAGVSGGYGGGSSSSNSGSGSSGGSSSNSGGGDNSENDNTNNDPCEDHNCDSNAECIDLDFGGIYDCSCNDGYKANDLFCIDINECDDDAANDCDDVLEECVNTIGNYTCVEKVTLSPIPSKLPSAMVSSIPSLAPVKAPTKEPTIGPTKQPTREPTKQPTKSPPTLEPTDMPLDLSEIQCDTEHSYSFHKQDYKCPTYQQHPTHRLFKRTDLTLSECEQMCRDNPECQYFSYRDHSNDADICLGCRASVIGELKRHDDFVTYELCEDRSSAPTDIPSDIPTTKPSTIPSDIPSSVPTKVSTTTAPQEQCIGSNNNARSLMDSQECCSINFKDCVGNCGSTKSECENCNQGGVFWICGPQNNCLAKLEACTDDTDNCCPGLTCVEQNQYWSRCEYVPGR